MPIHVLPVPPLPLADDDEDCPSVPSASAAHCSSSSCAQQARQEFGDVSVNDLAGYLEDSIVFPKKMSRMAEMMYT